MKLAPKSKIYSSATESVPFSEWVDSKESSLGIPANIIKGIASSTAEGEDYNFDEIEKSGLRKKAKACFKEISKEIKASVKFKGIAEKNKEEAAAMKKAEKQAERDRLDKEKTEMSASFEVAISKKKDKKVAGIEEVADQLAQNALGKKFKIAANDRIEATGKLSKDDFAAAFASLAQANEAGDRIGNSAGYREAQVALLAEQAYGKNWVSFFPAKRASDCKRVTKLLSVLRFCYKAEGKAEALLKMLPISSLRQAFEFKVTTKEKEGDADVAATKNFDAKEAFAKVLHAAVKEAGGELTQTEVTDIKNKWLKENYDKKGKEVPRVFSFFIDGDDNIEVVGQPKLDKKLALISIFTITAKGELLTPDEDGDLRKGVVSCEIPQFVRDLIDAKEAEKESAKGKKKGKKGKKEEEPAPKGKKGKKAAKAPEPEDEDEDEDEEEEEEVKPKKGKKAAPAKEEKKSSKKKAPPVEEDDDDDDDEDEDDADDDDDSDDDSDDDADDSDDDDSDDDSDDDDSDDDDSDDDDEDSDDDDESDDDDDDDDDDGDDD